MSHDQIAGTFDEWVRNGRAGGMELEHGDVVRQVIPRMGIRAGMQSLDLGCGTGWATRILASSAPGARAIGVDVSPQMIAAAEADHDLTSRARYEHGTFEDLHFPDNRFDRVFSMEALYYSIDLDRSLREIHRVLKPGGQAHVILDCYAERPTTDTWSEKVGLPLAHLAEDEWRDRVLAAGFESVETEHVRDSRGPGDEASFSPTTHYPDWATRVAMFEAGSLWIRAVK